MTTIYAQALGSINTKQLIGMFAGAVGSAGAAVAAGNAGGDTATADAGNALYNKNYIHVLYSFLSMDTCELSKRIYKNFFRSESGRNKSRIE